MRLVQLIREGDRRVALVEEPQLRLLRDFFSLYALAEEAIRHGGKLSDLVGAHQSDESLDYEEIYAGRSPWKLLPPVDHPREPARYLISGTGLTHLGSARDRASMHNAAEQEQTDSMKMFEWGRWEGRPAEGQTGIAPEWFYKGNGTQLQAPNDPLTVPAHAEDGGEEAEIAATYLIGEDGQPYRIGMTQGNEFSDHRFEKRNYLNLAGSKLRSCAIGPELVIAPPFSRVPGVVTIQRAGAVYWSQAIASGEEEMSHSLRNLEHHHFKFALHRRPGDLHLHFLGAYALSFGQGVELTHGDVMEVAFAGFGRPLRNPLQWLPQTQPPVNVIAMI